MTTKKEYLRDHRCQRTYIAYKCRIFEAVNLTLHGHYTHVCTVFEVFWHKFRKWNMSAKPGIHRWLLVIKNRYGYQMYNTYAYYW